MMRCDFMPWPPFLGAMPWTSTSWSTPRSCRNLPIKLTCANGTAIAGRGWNLKIQEAMAPALHDYATALALSLPEKPALVLSDDALRLYAVAAVLGRDAVDKHILVDTTELPKPAYQAHLRQRYGDRWPKLEL